jgi:colanic acid biosynthesis glycosyl transferase WcaI
MNILFFTHYFPPEVNAPASRTYEMCKRWVRDGHTVHVITGAPNAPDGVLYPGYKNRLSQTETIDGIRVTRVWTFLAANKGTTLRMVNYLSYMVTAFLRSLFVARPDIIIATSPQLFCGFAGWLASLFRRTRLVLESRDMFAESITTLTSVKEGRLIRWIRKLEFFLYRRGDRLVTVGPGYERKLVAGGVPKDHIAIITNGVDREVFDPATDGSPARAAHGLGGAYVVTYAGTIGMAHGLRVVLDAAEKLEQEPGNDVVFLLVGEGAEREELQREAATRGLRSVRFLGKIPKAAMPELLAASDCCLVHLRKAPLYTSVLPSKIFEMAHMQKPIILGVTGDAADVVREAGCGICIEPGDAGELVAAVRRLKQEPETARAMGKAGWEYVGANYDRDVLARKYLDLLTSIVGR